MLRLATDALSGAESFNNRVRAKKAWSGTVARQAIKKGSDS